jgi:hypothetical protein
MKKENQSAQYRENQVKPQPDCAPRPRHLADVHSNAVRLVLFRARQQDRANDRDATKCNRGKLVIVKPLL